MTRSELLRLMPRDAKDLKGANHVIALGYPTIAPALDDIVRCMKVADSEVADTFANFLGTIGAIAAPAIERELLPKEHLWLRYRVFTRILPKWESKDVMKLREVLMTIACLNPDPYDNDIRCIEILAERNLVDAEWLLKLIESKTKRLDQRNLLIERSKSKVL